jgi:hypothetical protein
MKKLMIVVLMGLMSVGLSIWVMADSGTDTPELTPTVTSQGAIATEETTPSMTPIAVDEETGDCLIEWFFDSFEPESCAAAEAVEGETAFQRFQYGYMVWTEPDDNIYVLHITSGSPMWLQTPDPFVPGSPERDFAWAEPQPAQSVQPRMGFGEVWRGNDDLRQRIGWAIQEWEFVYEGTVQVAVDGTIYLTDPNGSVFELLPDGEIWNLYHD